MDFSSIIIAVIGLLLSIGTFFFGRQSSAKKEGASIGANDTKVEQLSTDIEALDHNYHITTERITALDIQHARLEQSNTEIHRMIERIDATKASKEVVDGFRNEVASLRFDMDKRFDRIERILEGKKTH